MGSPTSFNKSMQRAKVYLLNDDGKWDYIGTGHATVYYLERSEEDDTIVVQLGFSVTDVDKKELLVHRIRSDDIYRKKDTIISWRDPVYSTDLALSFQETTACSYIWDHICEAQRKLRNLNIDTYRNETYHGANNELRELPPVELPTLPSIPKHVKVYRLNDDGKWDDQGTGRVTIDYLERSEELSLSVIDEENKETLLVHRISSDDIYKKEGDTIILWRDSEYSTDLALSFHDQDTTGCSYIWDHICNVQRNLHFDTHHIELPKASKEGNRPMVEQCLTRCQAKCKTTPIPLSREDITPQFGKTMKEAAENLNVSLSTLKRKCKVLGIFEWYGKDYSKRKVNESCKNQSDMNGAIQDLLAINRGETNLDENILTIKAQFVDDTIKFDLPMSSATLVAIQKEIEEGFNLNHDDYKLKYLDEDGDWILITSEESMKGCIKSRRNLASIAIRLCVLPRQISNPSNTNQIT